MGSRIKISNSTWYKFFKSIYMFKKGGILSNMVLLSSKGYNNLAWGMMVRNDTNGHKDLRANHFEEGEFDTEQEPKSSYEVN